MRYVDASLDFSKVPKYLKRAQSSTELDEIWSLRNKRYGKYYLGVSDSDNDAFDQTSWVLYNQNIHNKITSTGRIVFDSPMGLPADEIIKPALDKLRYQGLKLAEPSKFAISREARGILPSYLFTFYEIAQGAGIDSLVFIIRDKNVGLYERIVDAKVLVADVGYSYGTDYCFSLLECKIEKQLPSYFKSLEDK
jgi:hypothetical protein